MGVLGLWEVLDSVGHPIKIEGLEGKVLGVDANIWLYKFIRGFREKDNATSIESHKLGLFNRVSKLLFYRIKPVFVFDGPAPVLKRRTLERRQNVRNKHLIKVQDAALRILANQLKTQYPDAQIDDLKITMPNLISNNLVAAEKLTDEDRDLFYLPEINTDVKVSDDSESGDDYETYNPHEYRQANVDIHSKDFTALPAETRYEILHDIKQSRKRIRNSNSLPEDANSFSSFQLERLKARRKIQEKIEQCEKEICTNYTGELADGSSIQAFRVQSDSRATILYRNNTYDPKLLESHDNKTSIKHEEDVEPEVGSPQATIIAEDSKPELRDIDPPRSNRRSLSPMLQKQNSTGRTLQERKSPSVIKFGAADKLRRNLTALNKTIELESDSDETDVSLSSPEREKTPVRDQAEESSTGSSFISLHEVDSDTESAQHDAGNSADVGHLEECKDNTIDISDDSSIEEVFVGHRRSETNPLLQPGDTSQSTEVSKSDQDHDAIQDEVATKDPAFENVLIPDSSVTSPVRRSSPTIIDRQHISPTTSPDSLTSPKSAPVVDTPQRVVIGSQHQQQQQQPQAAPRPIVSPRKSLSQPIESTRQHNRHPDERPSSQMNRSSSQTQPDQPDPKPTSSSGHITNPIVSLQESRPTSEPVRTNKVTNKIVEDAKELLRLFGIPYIDAAGEAEAQCAKLEELKLTEGTITDDSDIWLFGSQNVYRHFFSDDKYVMQYKMTDIEFHVRMTRENLVCFAMLVGSDYTDGIMNVGPVTALEVLSEFPGDGIEPLTQFRDWHFMASQDPKAARKDKNRKKLLKYRLPDEFPSRAVYDGYLRPVADSSAEKFTWGTPELDELREYARRNFGWDPKRVDDKLVPVMKRLNEKKLQKTIDTFFFKTQANRNPEMFRSKRVNQALNKIAKRAAREGERSIPDVVNLSEDED